MNIHKSEVKETSLEIHEIAVCIFMTSLASRLNGYMYSYGKSLNVALFILMANTFVLG